MESSVRERSRRRRQRPTKSNSKKTQTLPYFSTLTHPAASSLCSSSPRFEARMEPAGEDLLKMARQLELEELAKIKFTPECVIYLDRLLCDAYVGQCPRAVDYHNRRDLVRIFNMIAKEIYGNSDSSPVVEGYGSFVMDMFNQKSDLDLSINFNNSTEVPRQKKIEILRKFNKKLCSLQRKGYVTSVQLIMTARVPIVKVTDGGTGIECDLSVDNRDGIAKSHIIHAISAIDERFRKLCFLMKSWAQAHNINSSKDRTLNSLSIVSLVAFHLQTCNPPILPPFSALLKEGADPVSVTKVVKTYLNYGNKNKESLAKLFITLFVKLASVEQFWQKGFCVNLYEGSWILKSWDHRSYSMSIEDFTDRSQNVARAVGTEELKTIYRCIHKSLYYLLVFLNGQMQGIQLLDLLFGTHTVSTLGVGGTSNIIENMNNLPTLQNPHPPKKRRLVEGLANNQVQQLSERNYFVQGLQGTEFQGVGRMQQQALGETRLNALASFTPSVSYQPSLGETQLNALASFTPSVSYQPPLGPSVSFQPPLPIPSTDIKLHHGYGAGTVPYPFGLNPVAFEGSYNPSIPSHYIPSQGSLSFVGTSHQQAVAPNPFCRSIHSHRPQVSHNQYRGDHTLYSHKNA